MDNAAFDKALAHRIRQTRESAGISLNKLSETSGIPYATLHRKVEKGVGSLLAKEVHSIANALDVTDADLWPQVQS